MEGKRLQNSVSAQRQAQTYDNLVVTSRPRQCGRCGKPGHNVQLGRYLPRDVKQWRRYATMDFGGNLDV